MSSHDDVPSQSTDSIDDTISTTDCVNTDTNHPSTDMSEEKTGIEIRNILFQIEQLFLSIKMIHDKVDRLQQEKEPPTGCGFSCTNNSLNM